MSINVKKQLQFSNHFTSYSINEIKFKSFIIQIEDSIIVFCIYR